jgi:hypothetical protein
MGAVNPREIAFVVWLGGFLAWGATKPDVRAAYWQVVKAFFQPKVVGPVIALVGWTVGLAALAHTVGIWKMDVLSDTVVWFVTVGMAFYFSLGNVSEDGWVRRTARRAVGAAVFVEVFVNLRVFSLPVELVLVPVLTFLVALGAYSAGKDEYTAAHKSVTFVMPVVGAIFAIYVTVSLIDDPKLGETTRKLLLPVWLTIGVMPLIYLVGLWSAYEQAVLRIGFRTDDPATRRRAKRAFARAVKWRAADAGGFAGHWIYDLAHTDSPEAAREVMRRFRASWRAERHDERLSNARANLELWIDETDETLAEIHWDALVRSWGRLDAGQHARLREEAARLSPGDGTLDALGTLPD